MALNVGDHVDVTKLQGVCVFCEKVILPAGLAARGMKQMMADHIQECDQHPYRGIKPIKYSDDPRKLEDLVHRCSCGAAMDCQCPVCDKEAKDVD